jgi:hypothetical protein
MCFRARLGGALLFFHDCIFYFLFRIVKPPEERTAKPALA